MVVDKETQYDRLAELVRHSLDMDAVYDIVKQGIGYNSEQRKFKGGKQA